MNWITPAVSNEPQLESLLSSLPASQDDARVRETALQKRHRLKEWMAARGFGAVLLSRRDNFAWLTAGGDSRVLNNSEVGFGHLLVTPERQYLLAHTMDACRLLEEQVPGQEFELIPLHWYEGDPRQKALELAARRVAADTSFAGAEEVSGEIALLHFPLSPLEIDRLRWLARQTGDLLEELAEEIHPGMSEVEIARQMQARFAFASIDLDVLILGSDERIFKYRHPLPTRKPVEQYILLHPAARRWGLHTNVSRSVHFGPPPETVARAYAAVATIEGRLLSALRPGWKFADILAKQKAWYVELDFAEEWRFHFQGGPTAYSVVDAARCLGETAVELNQSFDWFITVRGAKVEELSLLTGQGLELPSLSTRWPCRSIPVSGGTFQVPDLLIR